MRQHFETLSITTFEPGLYDFTAKAGDVVERAGIGQGIATFFIRHTSASLLVQENADRDVLADLETFMRRIVSRDPSLYRHTTEGARRHAFAHPLRVDRNLADHTDH